MECDPLLGMSSSVIHLIEFYEQDSHIRKPACPLPSTHPPLLAAWGGEGEWRGVHALLHWAADSLASDFLSALENVQGAGRTCSSRHPLLHSVMLFASAAGCSNFHVTIGNAVRTAEPKVFPAFWSLCKCWVLRWDALMYAWTILPVSPSVMW